VVRKLITALVILALSFVAYGPMGAGTAAAAVGVEMGIAMADCGMADSQNDQDRTAKCPIDGSCTLRCAPAAAFQLAIAAVLVVPFTGPQVYYFDLTDHSSASAAPPFRPPRLSILA
jgi:hypothetical protein